MFVSFNSFGQDVKVTVKKEKSVSEQYNDGVKAQAEATKAAAARAAAMSEAKTNIKVPLSVDFNDYTHIAIVDVLNSNGRRSSTSFKRVYTALLASPLTLINPINDKKKFKANSFYLRNTKNPKWLYLYLTASRIGVDQTISIVIRDYNNTIVYSETSMNVPFREGLSQIANF